MKRQADSPLLLRACVIQTPSISGARPVDAAATAFEPPNASAAPRPFGRMYEPVSTPSLNVVSSVVLYCANVNTTLSPVIDDEVDEIFWEPFRNDALALPF